MILDSPLNPLLMTALPGAEHRDDSRAGADHTTGTATVPIGSVHCFLRSTDRNKVVTLERGGEFTSHEGLPTSAFMGPSTHADSRFYGTRDISNTVEKLAGTVQDKLDRQ
jgi:hypothetical protein